MERIWNSIKELKAAMIMVVVQIAFDVVNIFYKMAVNDGMKMTVLIAYRFLFASAFILPLALFLERQLKLDCMFLESQQIIDYNLLLGVHFRAPEQLHALLEPPDTLLHKHDSLPQIDAYVLLHLGEISQGEILIPPKGLLLVTHEPSFVSFAPGPHIRGNTLRAFSVGDKEVDLLLPGNARLRVLLGVNMPAQDIRKLQQEETDSTEIELFEILCTSSTGKALGPMSSQLPWFSMNICEDPILTVKPSG
ncbi:hypothetical protein HYC85_024382 [Camellia sinensis]|uniref:PIPK domain-containing protein n=1 Tax=Camellia sinensis TaxID=4442 RepID=A0A7J7GC54_CAMSI|nr:hypothetical protein HYC85_024382 [Camellia sinensis]